MRIALAGTGPLLRVGHGARATGAVLVGQAFDAILHEPTPPLAHRVFMHAKARRHLLARQPLGAEQHHPASIRKRSRRLVSPYLSFQKGSLLGTQHHFIRNPTCHRIVSEKHTHKYDTNYSSR